MGKNELPCWAALAIIGGLALIVVFIWHFPDNSSEWASWVQAIGTIGALSAAVGISRNEIRQTEIREKSKDAALRNRVRYEVANLAYDVLGFAYRTANSKKSDDPRYQVGESEFVQLLERMTWVTRYAVDGDCLEAIRDLRELHVETSAIFRHIAYVTDGSASKLACARKNQEKMQEMVEQWRDLRGMYSHESAFSDRRSY